MADPYWPVHAMGGTKAMVMDGSGTFPGGAWAIIPVGAVGPNGPAKGMQFRFGRSYFSGIGNTVVTVGVQHGLPLAPNYPNGFYTIWPTVTSNGGSWGAILNQNAIADANNFYVAAEGSTVPGSSPAASYPFTSGVLYYFNWLAICVNS